MRVPVLVLLIAVPCAAAFASIPPSPHAEITRAAAREAGWPVEGIDALVTAVHAPDLEEIDWEPRGDDPARYDLAENYVAAHHCDRIPPADNATSFAAAGAHIGERLQAARNASDARSLVDALGQALHALQDCFSHSDFVDLSGPDQERFLQALLENGTAPAVRLVATAPDVEEPGAPSDPYAHDLFAKDSAGFNEEASLEVDGRTKFEAAQENATKATAHVLREVLEDLDPAMRDAIAELGPRAPDGFPIPVSWAWVLLVTAVAARRRPSARPIVHARRRRP